MGNNLTKNPNHDIFKIKSGCKLDGRSRPKELYCSHCSLVLAARRGIPQELFHNFW